MGMGKGWVFATRLPDNFDDSDPSTRGLYSVLAATAERPWRDSQMLTGAPNKDRGRWEKKRQSEW